MARAKTPTAVRVTWIDAYSSDGLKTRECAEEMVDGLVMHSVGFLVAKNSRSAKISRDHQPSETTDAFRDLMVIPKKYIVNIKEMK